MLELNALTPESLGALVEREQKTVRSIIEQAWRLKKPLDGADWKAFEPDLRRLGPEARCYTEQLLCSGKYPHVDTTHNGRLEGELSEHSIHHWLWLAIGELCPEAQEIVLPELRAHYVDLLESITRKEPALAALEQLGPASEVRRYLADTHLTQREVGCLLSYSSWWNPAFWVVFPMLLATRVLWDSSVFFWMFFGLLSFTGHPSQKDPRVLARRNLFFFPVALCYIMANSWLDLPPEQAITPELLFIFLFCGVLTTIGSAGFMWWAWRLHKKAGRIDSLNASLERRWGIRRNV